MIKWKHKKKILAGLKRDRLSGAFDRLSCSKKGKRRMEKLIYKTKYENQFTKQNIARIAKVALNKLPRESSLNISFVCPVCPVCPFCPLCPPVTFLSRGSCKKSPQMTCLKSLNGCICKEVGGCTQTSWMLSDLI